MPPNYGVTGIFATRKDDGTQSARDWVHMDAQSLAFYTDISRFIVERLPASEKPYSLLDIGPRTGAGLALLRLMHHPLSYAAVKLDPVTGIEIDPMFEREATLQYPDIEAITGDAFKLDRTFDVVMCSHTIEHVDDPDDFISRLQERARRLVVVACPFEEQDRIIYHKNTIGYHFLSRHGYYDMEVYRSPHWFNSLCVIAGKFVILRLAKADFGP